MNESEWELIDAHIHLWDLKKLRYGWLTDGYVENLISVPYKPICRDYLLEEYITETAPTGVVGAVHIQAAVDHPDPVDETEWLQACADRAKYPMSIVGGCDLFSDSLENLLDRHTAFPRFCGVRMLRVNASMFEDSKFRKGLKAVSDRGLVFDLDVFWESMEAAATLARAFPGLKFILGHAGFPTERTPAYFENWKRGMKKIAAAPNVFCKISGLGMYDPKWTVESIRPWVEHTLECFGVGRCMLGSNWPLDSLFSSYADLISAYKALLAGYSRDEQVALASANACNVYRVKTNTTKAGG